MVDGTELDFAMATSKFYEVLFEKMPELEGLFGDELKQANMFIVALQSIADKAQGDRNLADYMKMLGEKHRKVGLNRFQMELGREAFEQAVEAGGKNLDREQKQRYLDAFTELERAMGF